MRIRLSNYKLAYIILKIIRFLDHLTGFRGIGFYEMEAEEVWKECPDGIQTDKYYLIIWGKKEFTKKGQKE